MANNDVEIEIKTRVSKKEFEKIKRKVTRICKLHKKSRQIDSYYSPSHKSFLKPKYPYEWLSIRDRGGKLLLNYKHWYPPGAKYTTHCDEYETEISNQEQMDKILRALNIEKIVKVDKKRAAYIYKNKIEVALDEVAGLGYFIEAESLENKGSVEKVYQELTEFLKLIGVGKLRKIPGGYAAEMMRKKGLMN